MKTKIIIICALMATIFSSCGNKNKHKVKRHVPTEKELSVFENDIATLGKELNIQGLSYAIVNEGKVLKSKGIGFSDKENKIKADENTVYPIGAMADVFASALVLKLNENNKLDIKKYLAEYNIDDGKLKNITIKNILSHTSQDKPETEFIYNKSRFDLIADVLKSSSGKDFAELLKKQIARKFKMKNTIGDENAKISEACVSSVSDLENFSLAIDNKKLFENESTMDLMFRPVYLRDGEKTPSGLGWFVQFYNDKKYVWSFGQVKGNSSLILKSLTDSLTFIILANSENLNAPFGLQNGNIFDSPFATAFLKRLIIRNDSLPTFNFQTSQDSVKKSLEWANNSNYRDLVFNDYFSLIKIAGFTKNQEKVEQLVKLYQEAFPKEIPWSFIEKTPKAVIKNVGDYINIKKPFHIENDTTVNIFAVGEFVKEQTLSPWEYDNAEIYFDLKNEKKTSFDTKFDRQYRVDYDYPEISGNYSTAENIKFVQGDPSKTSYLFEIRFPWKTLNNIKPSDGLKIGFDINVCDNDGNGRKDCICWHFEKQQRPWENPSVFGTMVLAENFKGNTNDSLCTAVKTKVPINLDGKIESAWNIAPKYKMAKTTGDKMPDPANISAVFRSVWDDEYLYLLVEVTDNFKFVLPYTGDYGWIENEKHDTTWIMKQSDSQYAGGAASNRFVNTSLFLKKGIYTLNYSTNQSNSPNRWIRKRPETSFYGIAVY
jgi:CubicO group peptidase (beta-lactamase class C family)